MRPLQRWILFFLGIICFVFLTPAFLTMGADLLSSKIQALREELKLDHVSITSMGGGDDVILEGTVPSLEVSVLAEQISKQYFSSVFNVLTVEKPSFSHQLHISLFKKAAEGPNGYRYLEILKEGADNYQQIGQQIGQQPGQFGQPWYFLLSDNKEADIFNTELSLLAVQALESSAEEVIENTSHFKLNFKELLWEIQMKTVSMGNGYFKTSVKIFSINKSADAANPQTSQLLLEKTLTCKQGEWVALTGFTKFLAHFQANEFQASDLMILFQPAIQFLSAPEGI